MVCESRAFTDLQLFSKMQGISCYKNRFKTQQIRLHTLHRGKDVHLTHSSCYRHHVEQAVQLAAEQVTVLPGNVQAKRAEKSSSLLIEPLEDCFLI